SSDKSNRSIEVAGYIRGSGSTCLSFRAIYRAPDHYAVVFKDAADETPLLFAADRKLVVYDPVRSVLLCSLDNNIQFLLVQEGDSLRIHPEADSDKDRPSKVLVDLKSLLTRPFVSDKVVQTGDKKYRLTRTTEQGSALDCSVDLARNQPYTNIAI